MTLLEGSAWDRLSSWGAWRLVILTTLLVAVLALASVPWVVNKVNDQVDANHDFVCAIADLVVISGPAGQKETRTGPDQPPGHLAAELDFLQTVVSSKCPLIEANPEIKSEIELSITILERRIP